MKLRVTLLPKAGQCRHLFKKRDQREILQQSRKPTTVVTAVGEVQTNEEARVYVHDLDLFVIVQLPEDTLAVLSLGKLCHEHGFTFGWASGQKPHLTKEGKGMLCKTKDFVLIVVTGMLSSSGASSSSTSLSPVSSRTSSSSPAEVRSDDEALGNRRDLPNTQKPKNKKSCKTSQSGRRSSQKISKIQKCLQSHTFLMTQIRNVLRKWHQFSLPERPKLRILLADQDDQGSLQESHW